ncbi:MAG TPA: hypothetical protein VF789_19065 [Thermoanaerobaculia bacterium]
MADKTDERGGEHERHQQLARPAVEIEEERANFKALILKNPNFFGNLPEAGFPVVKALSQSTAYEELTCIGLHPEAEKLQAVVNIKRHGGYGGGTCTDGSIEYVRFFVRRPGGWHDLGVATFTSYDLPPGSPLPVSYSVEMEMDEARKYCTVENIVEVRGILSWNVEPPAGNPDWIPVWGNVLDVRVQIAPRWLHLVPIKELIADQLLTIDPSVLNLVDLQATINPKPAPPPPPYAALKKKYEGKDVPGHRFGFTEAQKLLKSPLSATTLAKAVGAQAAQPQGLQPLSGSSILNSIADIAKIVDSLIATKGDRTYEELDCVGYNPETRMLSGVISVKRTSGYSGDLCEPGSTEYVGFWAFYDGAWHSLGSAQVNVHDLDAVSEERPVRYAVFRGANLPERLCGDITGLRLRAILSWQTPPTGPDFDPVWGNVVDTHIQPIITAVLPGDQRARIMRINRVTVTKIDGSGFAQASEIAGDCHDGNDSPFGGPLYIEGDFTVKSDSYFDPATGDILAGQHPPAYQVFVHKVGSAAAPSQLTNPFYIAIFPVSPPAGDPAVTFRQEIQTIGGAQYYLYREGVVQAVNPRMLAVWEADGFEDGAYDIEVKGFVWNGAAYVPMATPSQTQRVYLYNGYLHTELDANGDPFTIKRPELTLSVDPPVGDCGDVTVGMTVTGKFSVTDHYFGSLGIAVVPISIGGIPQPINDISPSAISYDGTNTGGTGGDVTWTLDTTGMTPCGYTIVLHSWDRALVGDACHGHYNQVAVGFCLRQP